MKIGVNTYSFRKELKSGVLTLSQIFSILSDFKDVDGIELLDHHIFESYGPDLNSRIAKIKEEAASFGLKIYAMGPHMRCWTNNQSEVDREVKEFKKWIDAAHAAGIPTLRMQGGRPKKFWDAFRLEHALGVYDKTLSQVVEYAASNSVNLGLETHHHHSSDPGFLKIFAEKYKDTTVGIIYDWGNFTSNANRFKSLKTACLPYMHVHNHAKMYNFDPKTGLCPDYDVERIIEGFRNANFKDYFSIEFEGKADGMTGVFRSIELLRYYLSGKSHKIDMITDPLSLLPA